MRFGRVPTNEAEGAILAHTLTMPDGPIRKGTLLDAEAVRRIAAFGVTEITVARIDNTDTGEDAAAAAIGAKLDVPGFRLGPVFTGRVNLIAETPGLLHVDAERVATLNAVDEGITLATLPDLARLERDQLVATVKIIPYSVPTDTLERAIAAIGEAALRVVPFRGGSARLILTHTPGFKRSLLDKGAEAVRKRVEDLGYTLVDIILVPHELGAVADVLGMPADLTLILGASATSDREDVAPAAVVRAGGTIERFGMPVDPGNLLFLGTLNGNPVVGLPGCARSPALNGVDWVLERVAAGLEVRDADIAAMGVGGLLKEMPGRPQPRRPQEE
ncbi:MAG: molybdopterin-binding protein [Paracoccaceae bacterium]|nr:molybdopterin-binding protein [Paracoccaceae bacterium]